MSAREDAVRELHHLAREGRDPAVTLVALLPLALIHVTSPWRSASGAWSLGGELLARGGPWARGAVVVLLVVAFLWAVGRIRELALPWGTGALAMALEGALWGVALRPGLVLASSWLPLAPGALVVAAPPFSFGDLHARLGLAAGAGLWEELLFRAGLLGGGAFALARLFALLGWGEGSRVLARVLALVVSSLVFAWVHVLGDPGALAPEVFAFRALAGLAFGLLFLFRGLAVTAWAHAGYDALVLVLA